MGAPDVDNVSRTLRLRAHALLVSLLVGAGLSFGTLTAAASAPAAVVAAGDECVPAVSLTQQGGTGWWQDIKIAAAGSFPDG